ncbi:MAG TPA: PadR family transcriptional regulator [Mycobacteriales bacterium]|nr:PadR family transcriptional regulator [Mycobacteriales bacterium]
MLELAVLGLLNESPMHGYELNKRLKGILGPFRTTFYGSLYPCLNTLQSAGYITTDDSAAEVGKRKKTTYKLTAEGKERLQEQLAEGGPAAWEDESFGVRFAFFAQTDAETRLRILEGRRSRLEERKQTASSSMTTARERIDRYTLELQRHGLEAVEREVRWLNELIATERAGVAARPARTPRNGMRSTSTPEKSGTSRVTTAPAATPQTAK